MGAQPCVEGVWCAAEGNWQGARPPPPSLQVQFSVLKALKTYSKALAAFCTSGRLEAALLNTIQVRAGAAGSFRRSRFSRMPGGHMVRAGRPCLHVAGRSG